MGAYDIGLISSAKRRDPELTAHVSLDARLRFRHEFLPSLVDPSLRLNHSTPSLHPHYRASTLLRVDPPLCHASGLLTSWGFHLGISLGIVTTGSHVPRESLNRARATFTPVTIKAVSRSRLDRIPGQRLEPGFDDVHTLSTPHRWFTRVRLLGSYLTGSRPAFSRTLTTRTLDPCSFG